MRPVIHRCQNMKWKLWKMIYRKVNLHLNQKQIYALPWNNKMENIPTLDFVYFSLWSAWYCKKEVWDGWENRANDKQLDTRNTGNQTHEQDVLWIVWTVCICSYSLTIMTSSHKNRSTLNNLEGDILMYIHILQVLSSYFSLFALHEKYNEIVSTYMTQRNGIVAPWFEYFWRKMDFIRLDLSGCMKEWVVSLFKIPLIEHKSVFCRVT